MSSFEKEITKIINESYGGDTDRFLNTIYQRAILFILVGGFNLCVSLYIFKTGGYPIFTPILGFLFFFIGMFTHYTYNRCYKFLNKDE